MMYASSSNGLECGILDGNNDASTDTEYNVFIKEMSNYTPEKGRSYQVALCELATNENCIICLPTGCGKTYIALSVAKMEHLPKAIENTKKKIIFLANSIPLVTQQAEYFKKHIASSSYGEKSYIEKSHVKAITGDMNTDNWNRKIWNEVMEDTEILVMTPEILKIALNHDRISFEQITLLILDECHHATKSHPMAVIMRDYCDIKAKHSDYELPRVIGLTATIIMGTSKADKIPEEVNKIEKLLCSRAVTYPQYAEVLKYSTSAQISIIQYKATPRGTGILKNTEETILALLESKIAEIKKSANALKDSRQTTISEINHPSLTDTEQMFNRNKMSADEIVRTLQDVKKIFENKDCVDKTINPPPCIGLGLYAGRLAAKQKIAFLQMMMVDEEALENLKDVAEEALTEVVAYCESIMFDCDKALQVQEFISSKVEKLYEILLTWKETIGKNETLSGIVFCKERLCAQILSWLFLDASENCQKFSFIKPSFVVGSGGANNDLDEQKVNAAKQDETIQRFHKNEINLIFATNVLEEGLDVPACNIVIRFDPITTYPSYIQSMGRARKKGAVFQVMTSTEDYEKTKTKMRNFQSYSYALANHLINNKRNILNVVDEEVVEDEDPTRFAINPNNPNSPKITLTESVQLIYHYCQILSTDRIVCLEPTSWWKDLGVIDNKTMFKAYVALPINAVIRDTIEGKPADNKNTAKRHAFLETCKRLYLEKAFADDLFPLRREIPKEIIAFLDNIEAGGTHRKGKKIGTKGSTWWYQKKIPDTVNNNRIGAGDSFKAYRIELTLAKSTTETVERRKLYNFDNHRYTFAILTKIDLQEIPPMCLYDRHGIVTCNFVNIKLKNLMVLTDEEITKIKAFQNFVFSECLNINHPLMSIAKENAFLVTSVVRVDNNFWDIDWNLLNKIECFDKTIYTERRDEDERRNHSYSPGELEDAVVVPWYTLDKTVHFYCVCYPRPDLRPSSPMDDAKAKTFEEHYKSQYNLKIVNPSEPFLTCISLGSQLNFLTRKRDDDKTSKSEKKLNQNNSGILVMIPEFVRLFPIPASLLVQSRFLPSVLHRMYRLMLSKQIHLDVAKACQWNAALKWKAQDESVLEFYERQVPSPAKIIKFSDVSDEDNVMSTTTEKKLTTTATKISNGVTATKPKKTVNANSLANTVHLDYIHPDEITENQIEKHRQWKQERVKKATISRPKSSINPITDIPPLVESSTIIFQSLDAKTDFDTMAGPSPVEIMEALTLSNANDILSLENLEVIGDSFLKYAVSTHIFCENKTFDEGQLTSLRNRLVSNYHLYQFGESKSIGEYLSGGIFVPLYSWLPPGRNVPYVIAEAAADCDKNFDVFNIPKNEIDSLENMSKDEIKTWIESKTVEIAKLKIKLEKARAPLNSTLTHTRLGDKSISDCIEALIGVYYMKGGQDGAFAFMEWLGLRAPGFDGNEMKYGRRTPPESVRHKAETKKPESFVPFLSDLESLIDYKFKDQWLVVEAFSHPGYLKNNITGCYQRLEFIGDAVLDFLVTNHIYKNSIRKSPGELTDLRSALVNNVTFGSLAVKYKLHNYLLLFCKKLRDAIGRFEDYQEANNHVVTGHFTLLHDMETPIAQEIEVPKVLGDIFESLCGAIFLDCGMSLDQTWKVFYRLMKNEIDQFTKYTPLAPVRELHELYPPLKFEDVSEGRDKQDRKGMTDVRVKVYGKTYFGTGSNKKQAKQAAAKYALRCIKSDNGKTVG